jgi:hypothetical protein
MLFSLLNHMVCMVLVGRKSSKIDFANKYLTVFCTVKGLRFHLQIKLVCGG